MSQWMKRLTAVTVLSAVLSPTSRAEAETYRIEAIKARQTEERSFDRARLEYRVDGGPTRKLKRILRRGDVWTVGLDVTFERELRIEVYEYDRTVFNPDEKLFSVTLRPGALADGEARGFDQSRHGAHYWVCVGRGSYTPPEPPETDPARPKPPRWEDGGTYTNPDTASQAGNQLVASGVADRFRVEVVYPINRDGVTYYAWKLWYVRRAG